MDNFKAIYFILRILEHSLDGEFDINDISPGLLGITKERRDALLVMMQEQGYICGLKVIRGVKEYDVHPDRLRITLRGLEYLETHAMNNVGGGILKDVAKVVIETDTENPVPVAVITAEDIDTADGYRVRLVPNYNT